MAVLSRNELAERQRLGASISLARHRARLGQVELAEAVDVTQTTISAWETGRRTPDLVAALRVAKACGVTLDELAGLAPLPPLR